MIEVSLFFALWAERFLARRIRIVFASQNRKRWLKRDSNTPWRLFTRRVRPRIKLLKIMKNMFSKSVKSNFRNAIGRK